MRRGLKLNLRLYYNYPYFNQKFLFLHNPCDCVKTQYSFVQNMNNILEYIVVGN